MNKEKNTNKLVGTIFIIFGVVTTFITLKASFTEPIKENITNLFILFLALPWILFGNFLYRYDNIQEEEKNKRSITIITKYKDIKVNRDSDGLTLYYIITSWVNPSDNKLYLFKSECITKDLADIAAKSYIKEYPVSYEYNNIENYEMDISKIEGEKYE